MGAATARAAVAEAVRFDVGTFRQRRLELLARRQVELETLARLDAIWPGPGGEAPKAYAW